MSETPLCPETDVIESDGIWIARGCAGKRGHAGPHMLGPLKPPRVACGPCD